MIDPHVHLRDGKEAHKETLRHGLEVAWRVGLDGVFEMPNTDPPLTGRETIEARLDLADRLASPVFHGLYAGLTADPAQIGQVVDLFRERFPRVVGLKLYAGRSTGSLAVLGAEEQRRVFRTLADLDYRGVVAVHCEKQSLMRPELWDEREPFTHTLTRPPEAEFESVRDVLGFAAEEGFRGTLHVCHVSTVESVELVQQARRRSPHPVTCGVTPQHLLLHDELMKREDGFTLKVNPPLRPLSVRDALRRLLREGAIDWIETDHAPHALAEKRDASGLPGFPVYPRLLAWMRREGYPEPLIDGLTHDRIASTFGLRLPNRRRAGEPHLEGEYGFDPYREWGGG